MHVFIKIFSDRRYFSAGKRKENYRKNDPGDQTYDQPYAYYRLLGIPKTARVADIKHAYFRLAKTCHPDVIHAKSGASKSLSNEQEKEIEDMKRKFNVSTLHNL